MMFAHGFGCDQAMWRHVAPAFEHDHTTIVFDNVRAGGSDPSTYDPVKYGNLAGYAADLTEIIRELRLVDVVLVGHSVSAMIGVLAAVAAPEFFSKLVLVGPSPGYVDEGNYVGGFSASEVQELLDLPDENPMAWSRSMAPAIMGNVERPERGAELTASLCGTDPEIAKTFARANFLADNRADLAKLTIPVLILECSEDIIAPLAVGQYVHNSIAGSKLVVLEATGHCPNLSAPGEVITAIRGFV